MLKNGTRVEQGLKMGRLVDREGKETSANRAKKPAARMLLKSLTL